jgi:hypothetical protein
VKATSHCPLYLFPIPAEALSLCVNQKIYCIRSYKLYSVTARSIL